MKPLWYVDFRVAAGVSDRGPAGSSIAAVAMFLRTVHGVGAAQGFRFASALPGLRCGAHAHPGTVLRVFTEERAQCEGLADAIEASPICASTVVVSRVRAVPSGIEQSVSYRRVRTPSRKSAQRVGGEARRLANIKRCDSLPYLRMFSRSTGQQFSLRVEPTYPEQLPSAECEPDAYGFCVRERPFCLPLIPLQPAPWDVLRVEATNTRRAQASAAEGHVAVDG
jgi:hypothetical protein